MRVLAASLLLISAASAAPTADEYFDIGVDYLRKGFFRKAAAAFAESLVRAPGQPVPLALSGVADAADGRSPARAATLLRSAFARLPKDKAMRFDLAKLLPSPKALALLVKEYRAALKRAKGVERLDVLTVLAFLEVNDGGPATAPALDALLKALPKDAYALKLDRVRKAALPVRQ